MKQQLTEHLLSILFVTAVLLAVLFGLNAARTTGENAQSRRFDMFGDIAFVDANDPFERTLFKDVVNAFFPGQAARNDSLSSAVLSLREREFGKQLQSTHVSERLNPKRFGELAGMYVMFIVIYVIVMALTYYGVQTIAVWRFCRKAHATDRAPGVAGRLASLVRKVVLGIASFVLFSPAYVIAYSLRTELNTDTSVFIALLGVISNGLLLVYANKFYAFLIAESRKGYVQTALVKNLHSSYSRNAAEGIPYRAILRPFKRFKGHVFGHIFTNARFQYLATLKEQASFLITGLIIIEMALNVHGHLSYELLRQLLYRNYDIVLVIILGIFYVVKATEVFTDGVMYAAQRKYQNRD